MKMCILIACYNPCFYNSIKRFTPLYAILSSNDLCFDNDTKDVTKDVPMLPLSYRNTCES